MILKNENDIYIYFETIGQLEPQSVIDVGMFLKRIGGVSRKAMNREAPAQICLDGVDWFQELKFPVWDQVYDLILTMEEFLSDKDQKRYDLAIFLGTDEIIKKLPLLRAARALSARAKYVLLDGLPDVWKSHWKDAAVRELNLEGNCYYLLNLGA